ncbi:MAG TPA: AcvB/VirJ family lysyl-phosphatidylglycerol hydrolase [Vicinamibacterales bacterium]|nr:AcvB/VirJ family lysyl-phosphatidylglycerol hydrolase [Vicinamibacterales bacterium]
MRIRLAFATFGMLLLAGTAATNASTQSQHRLMIRGHVQQLQLYGPADGTPVIVASGDGGWIHLGPHVAELLGARGFFVVGFDVKAYLAGFTTDSAALRAADEPGDFKALAAFASAATGRKPILIGVSEGAGLSVLAGADPETKAVLAGVVGLGLPDRNELGWRWKDSLIYLTHRPANEPGFNAATVVTGVAPLPLALLQSTHDEFVPLAETQRIFAQASEPKRLWVIDAVNHRFSNNLPEFDGRLMEAVAWVQHNQPR